MQRLWMLDHQLNPIVMPMLRLPLRCFALLGAVVLCACPPAQPGIAPGAQEPAVSDVADARPRVTAESRAQAKLWLRQAYPDLLRSAGIWGESSATFVVLPDGTVDRATIRVRNATHQDFRPATAQVVSQLRFVPAERGGQAVAFPGRVAIAWQLPDPDITYRFGRR
jgi:TonB family protein